jgi:hypothetical protein
MKSIVVWFGASGTATAYSPGARAGCSTASGAGCCDLYKYLMNIAAVFVDLETWAAIPPIFVVKFDLGK